MKGLETGKGKIQKICDALRQETLEPAKQEAREIVENARLQAQEIVQDAQKKCKEMLTAVEKDSAQRKTVFESALHMACRQGIEHLKQKIEEELFNKELFDLVAKDMGDSKTVATILNALMKMMENQGIEDEFIAVIPKTMSPRAVSSLLGNQILERLKNHSMEVGDFAGGVQLRLKGRQITIDVTDVVVRELIARYIRRDFRDLVFGMH